MTVYVVTGAASGIGKAIVDRFATEVGTVLALDITYDGISRKHTPSGEIVSVEFDVKSEQSWLRLVDTLMLEYGGLDVLVNNAALFSPSPMLDEDATGFMKVVEVNQLATFLGMKAATLAMTDNGGSIINICSTGGIRGFEGAFSYSSTKWAIRGMTKVAARELALKKIRVNAVHPGLIDTPMVRQNTDENLSKMISAVPSGRLGLPEEVANIVAFLASDQSQYVTGAEFVVDGGQTI